MNRELVKAVLILPGTALVYVPGAIVWLTAPFPDGWAPAGAADLRFWIGVVLAVPGFALAVWMLSAVNVMLAAEALLLGSWYIAGWMAVFVVLNTVYFIRREEPALAQRFGESYRLYKANVPRWIPRWRPWDAT